MHARSGFPFNLRLTLQSRTGLSARPLLPAASPPLEPLRVLLFHLFLNICHQDVWVTSSEGTVPSAVATCNLHLPTERSACQGRCGPGC